MSLFLFSGLRPNIIIIVTIVVAVLIVVSVMAGVDIIVDMVYLFLYQYCLTLYIKLPCRRG